MPQTRPILLLTRPEAQSLAFAEACAARLGSAPDTVISPVLEIRYRDASVDPGRFAAVILTSGHGARALARLAPVAGVHAICVGDRTAEVARSLGMHAESASGTADDLVALLTGRVGPFLHLRGAESRGDVAERLSAAGTPAQSLVLYDQLPLALNAAARAALAGQRPVVAPLFSPRSAALFSAAASGARAPLRVAALSPAVAKAWRAPEPAAIMTAARPDAEAMLASVVTLLTGDSP